MEQPENARRWYARREGVIRGPFTSGDVTRYILLGRIKLEDELSEDQASWQTAKTLTRMLPDEISQLSSWGDYQRLVVARMQVDERSQERRDSAAGSENDPGGNRYFDKERRVEDSLLSLADFAFSDSETNRPEKKNTRRLGTLVLTVVLAMLVFVWLAPAVR